MATKKPVKAREYVCNRFPSLQIRDAVHFEAGLFKATTQEQIDLIESNDWYTVHIHPRDAEIVVGDDGATEVAEALRLAALAEREPRVRQGQIGTLMTGGQ